MHSEFTYSAVKALAVVVVVEGLDPAVSGLDREPAADALGGEEVVPVLLAVGQPVLQVERRVGEDLAAVGAHKALRVERAVHRLQAVLEKGGEEHLYIFKPSVLSKQCSIPAKATLTASLLTVSSNRVTACV